MKVKTGHINDFFEVPFNVYKNTNYISPFKDDIKRFLGKDNPLMKHFGELTYFVAYNDQGTPVGRITAHIHRKSNELHNINRGYFGFFDCEDNLETAKALLDAAEAWNKARGMDEIMGNFNLTAMQQMGVMVEGFENIPYIDQLYSPPHIYKLLEKLGYTRSFPVNTFDVDIKNFDHSLLKDEKAKALLEHPDYKWETMSKKHMTEQLQFACDILNEGFKNNPMFTPLTFEEFYFQAKDMSLIIDEKITSFVKYKNEASGIIICIPDLNPILKEVRSRFSLSLLWKFFQLKRNPKRCLLVFASVKPDQHSKGLGLVMLYKAIKEMKDRGYESMGITWISDENKAPLSLAKKINAKVYHRLYLFGKKL
jgi:hypothetical protein